MENLDYGIMIIRNKLGKITNNNIGDFLWKKY